MKMLPVESSNIARIGYDADRRELRVEFKSGVAHDYVAVPPEAHSKLMSADSHGKHFNEHVKGRYENRKSGDAAPAPAPATPRGSPPLPPTDLDAAVRRFRGEQE